MTGIVEIEDPRIIVVLARKNGRVWMARMHIDGEMLVRVPAAVAHVEAAHEGHCSINQT